MRIANVPLTGHPDRVCDLIAAGIADEYLRRDPETRIRCHVAGGRGAIFVTGEVLTSADFDVSHLVQRLLGQLGVIEAMEPFVALETVESEQVGRWRLASTQPTWAMGYATRETDSHLPLPMHQAKLLARALDDKRLHDPDWFWLGAGGTVVVNETGHGQSEVIVEVEHGSQPLEAVRPAIKRLAADLSLDGVKLEVNPLGELDKQGIESAIGRSSVILPAYGHHLPALANPAGRDWHTSEVYGAWLARYLAKRTLECSEAKAVMTEMSFRAGEAHPSKILVRDEKGRDLSAIVILGREKIADLLADWRRVGLMSEAVRGGLVGDPHLPWENV